MTSFSRKSKIQSKPSQAIKGREDLVNEHISLENDFDVTQTTRKARASKRSEPLIVSPNETDTMLETCDERIRDRMASILDTVLSAAEGGNLQAAKFFLERLLPDPRDRLINFDFREISSVNDAANAWSDVFKAMAQGKITLKEAQSIGELLKDYIDATTALNKTMPKLADKNVAMFFVKANEALFFSVDGSDQKNYFVVRQDNESESDFHNRAEAEMRQRFPEAEATVFSHAQYLLMFPEGHSDLRHIGSESMRRYLKKIREKTQARGTAPEAKSLLSN